MLCGFDRALSGLLCGCREGLERGDFEQHGCAMETATVEGRKGEESVEERPS